MFKKFSKLTLVPLFFFSIALAKADQTFLLVSKASGKCISLKSADQNDGGGLMMRNCENLPDYFVTGHPSVTQLIFALNSSRNVCIIATETPDIHPGGQRDKVGSRNCTGQVGSAWKILGAVPLNDDYHKVEKQNGIDPTNFCLTENLSTSELELDICQNNKPEQFWKTKLIMFPSS
jgi:hypothetical protein